jgi:Flp pilus assembly protein TadG
VSRPRDDAGSTVVEFALMALVLFTVMFGAIQYGYHYWALQTAAASARELARELAVGNDPTSCGAVAADRAGRPALGPVDVEVTYDTGAPALGAVVTVTVTFESLGILPVPLPRDNTGKVVVSQTATQTVNDLEPDPSACSVG